MLTKEQLRTKGTQNNRRYRLVTLHDGTEVRIRSLTRSEYREWLKHTQKRDGRVDLEKIAFSNDVLLAMVIVDEKDALVFTIGDAFGGMFDSWDTEDTALMIDAAIDHCGFVVDENDIKDAIKNSEETPGKGSSGVSAPVSE